MREFKRKLLLLHLLDDMSCMRELRQGVQKCLMGKDTVLVIPLNHSFRRDY